MRPTHILCLLSLSLLTTACGDSLSNVGGPSPLPSAHAALADTTPVIRFGTLTADNPRYSCPTGAPSFLLPIDLNASNRVTLRWSDARVDHYQVQLDYMDPDTNAFRTIQAFTTASTSIDILLGNGTFQARVRSQSCDLSGPWETSPAFSTSFVDGGIIDPIVPPVFTPELPVCLPQQHLVNGHCDYSPGDNHDYNGHDNHDGHDNNHDDHGGGNHNHS